MKRPLVEAFRDWGGRVLKPLPDAPKVYSDWRYWVIVALIVVLAVASVIHEVNCHASYCFTNTP
jgi:hypothetical protein